MMWVMLLFVAAGFLVVDINMAWYHYRLNKRCAVAGWAFLRWWLANSVLKISICAGLMLIFSIALLDR
jgi:hypothetical protein